MKILYDYQIFTEQKYGGISRYFANLHYGINAPGRQQSKLGLLFTNNAYIENNRLPAGGINDYVKEEPRRIKYNKWYCKYLVQQNNFDVFHPTYYNSYFLKSLKKPFVLTVHDMIHELFPQYFDPAIDHQKFKGEIVERADHIIAISECTKNDVQNFFNIPESKISVIHHGYQMQVAKDQPNLTNVDGDYILFVGKRDGYKNFELFIRSAALIILKHALKLICAGGSSFQPGEMKLINELNLANNVVQLYLSDNQLMHLYKNAIAFVYPSLYEGFGLPILEAFFNNCPVIMSNTSSLYEVGGEAAEYFDPAEEQSIAFAIERVINNNSRQQELKTKGKERLKLFNFENCLQKTLEVYRLLT